MKSRELKILVAKFRITLTDHPEGAYSKLFRAAFESKRATAYRGSQYLILGKIAEHPNYIEGFLYNFTNIEDQGQWLNLNTLNFALPEEKNEISVPEKLKPNAR